MAEKRKKKSSKKQSGSKSQASAKKKTASLKKQRAVYTETKEEKSISSTADIINTWGFPLISIAVASFVCLYIIIYVFRSSMELGNAKWMVFGVVFVVWLGYVGSSIWSIKRKQKKKVPEEEIW